MVIYARGVEYSSSEAAPGMDFQKRYLDLWMGFIGFTDITSILVEPTLSDPSDLEKALDQALEQATAVARKFRFDDTRLGKKTFGIRHHRTSHYYKLQADRPFQYLATSTS